MWPRNEVARRFSTGPLRGLRAPRGPHPGKLCETTNPHCFPCHANSVHTTSWTHLPCGPGLVSSCTSPCAMPVRPPFAQQSRLAGQTRRWESFPLRARNVEVNTILTNAPAPPRQVQIQATAEMWPDGSGNYTAPTENIHLYRTPRAWKLRAHGASKAGAQADQSVRSGAGPPNTRAGACLAGQLNCGPAGGVSGKWARSPKVGRQNWSGSRPQRARTWCRGAEFCGPQRPGRARRLGTWSVGAATSHGAGGTDVRRNPRSVRPTPAKFGPATPFVLRGQFPDTHRPTTELPQCLPRRSTAAPRPPPHQGCRHPAPALPGARATGRSEVKVGAPTAPRSGRNTEPTQPRRTLGAKSSTNARNASGAVAARNPFLASVPAPSPLSAQERAVEMSACAVKRRAAERPKHRRRSHHERLQPGRAQNAGARPAAKTYACAPLPSVSRTSMFSVLRRPVPVGAEVGRRSAQRGDDVFLVRMLARAVGRCSPTAPDR